MSRYSIALGKKSDRKEPERVQFFGFGDSIVKAKRRFDRFNPPENSTTRVSIVYTDPKKLFVGTHAHFHNNYLLCKSTENKLEVCCESFGKPLFKIACALLIHNSVPDQFSLTQRIKPWVFSRGIFEKLDELNKVTPLKTYNFLIIRSRSVTTPNDQFKNYSVQALPGEFNWQVLNDGGKQEIITAATPTIKNLKYSIGQDLSLSEIHTKSREPDRYSNLSRAVRNRENLNRRDHTDFKNILLGSMTFMKNL